MLCIFNVGTRPSQYQCTKCGQVRNVIIDENVHQERSSKMANKMAVFSDIHRCEGGFLGINNLQVDHNFHIRSFDILSFPTREEAPALGIPGVPSTRKDESGDKTIIITEMLPERTFRLKIQIGSIATKIIIGDIDFKEEIPLEEIQSDNGQTKIEYYKSDILFNSNIKAGMTELVKLIELLPPTSLGLVIETLRYIHSLEHEKLTDFHILQLKTIFSSHETYFQQIYDIMKVEEQMRAIDAKYGYDVAKMIRQILLELHANMVLSLRDFVRTFDADFEYMIYIINLMENEKLIEIERPGIITDIDLQNDTSE